MLQESTIKVKVGWTKGQTGISPSVKIEGDVMDRTKAIESLETILTMLKTTPNYPLY